MNEVEFLGYLVLAIITLGGFVAVIVKFVQPINDLRVVIQKLNDCIEALRNDNDAQNRRIEKHGEQIDDLNNRVGKMETKMEHIRKSG
jgi:outer membrane murein-binding lipoprotein Lpp